MTQPELWQGCYAEGWRNLIVPEAFAHPAKAARGLVIRIFDELFAVGALKPGDTVLDPFAGIFTTGIEGASRGVNVVGVELEPKFVELAKRNIELHRRAWEAMGRPLPVILQGDSRRLREVVAGVDCVISSPPYSGNEKADYLMSENGKTRDRDLRRGYRQGEGCFRGSEGAYGQTEGQLGAMKPGTVEAVIGSPPYAESVNSKSHGIDWSKMDQKQTRHRRRGPGTKHEETFRNQLAYGETPGQMGAMPAGTVDAVVGSPPYVSGGHHPDQTGAWNTSETWDGRNRGLTKEQAGYGKSAGQLGQMKEGRLADCLVSSPPYEGSLNSDGDGIDWTKARRGGHSPETGTPRSPSRGAIADGYGAGADNVGNFKGDTFWTAARQVLTECHAVLRPGGVAVWIVKQFVRNKQIVEFPDDWRRLCESVGFESIKEIRAMLTEETRLPGLFGGDIVKKTKRASFFRRLAEAKGSPPIDWEVVLFCRKRAEIAHASSPGMEIQSAADHAPLGQGTLQSMDARRRS